MRGLISMQCYEKNELKKKGNNQYFYYKIQVNINNSKTQHQVEAGLTFQNTS